MYTYIIWLFCCYLQTPFDFSGCTDNSTSMEFCDLSAGTAVTSVPMTTQDSLVGMTAVTSACSCSCGCSAKERKEIAIQVDTAELQDVQDKGPTNVPVFSTPLLIPNPSTSTPRSQSVLTNNVTCSPITKSVSVDHESSDFVMLSSSSSSGDSGDLYKVDETESESSDASSNIGSVPVDSKDRMFLVYESCLDELFHTCQKCGKQLSEIEKIIQGGNIKVKTTCIEHCTYTWSAQPILRGMAAGNLLTASAILFSGFTYARYAQFANLLKLQTIAERTFYEVQKDLLWPVVQEAWKIHKESLHRELRGTDLKFAGDGRCDSPGHTAKYGTYSLKDCATDKLVEFAVIQKSEVKNSSVMEKEGLLRCLDSLKESNLKIAQIATDRHPQICAYFDRQTEIIHQFDLWHVAKSISKKLSAKARSKNTEKLATWIRSVVNHLWWSCASCEGSVEMLRDMWNSTLHHVVNVHSWGFSDIFFECTHEEMSVEEESDIGWLEVDTEAHDALRAVVQERKLQKDLAKMTNFAHTGALEVYHSMLTKYCPKRQHFHYEGMLARTMLAALDHNNNTGRGQATTSSGEQRFRYEWSKISKCWVAKPISVGKDYSYLHDMIARVMLVRENNIALPLIVRPTAAEGNIAPEPRPDKAVILDRHQTRLKLSL